MKKSVINEMLSMYMQDLPLTAKLKEHTNKVVELENELRNTLNDKQNMQYIRLTDAIVKREVILSDYYSLEMFK